MMAISIKKEEQSNYGAFDKVNAVLQEKQIETVVLEKSRDGQIRITKYSQTIGTLTITQVRKESRLGKCCCCCLSTCSCDELMSELCESVCLSRHKFCRILSQDSHVFIKKHVRKAQSLGVEGIYKSLKNIYTDTPIGSTVKDVCVWGLFISFLVLFLKSFVLLIKNNIARNDSYDYWFKISGTTFSGIGLLFSFIDTIFHVYHRRFKTCKEWKQWRKDNLNNDSSCCLRCLCCKRKDQRDSLTTEEDSMMEETTVEDEEWSKSPDPVHCCRDMCMCCPRSITTLIDVFRVFFAETLFYVNLILSVFELCTELVINSNDLHMIKVTTWFGFIFSFFSTLCFNYIARVFILAGTIYSVAKIRSKRNIFKGAMFQIMFVLYSYGLMALQICMIVAIGGMYYNEYNERYKEATIPMNISNVSSVNHTTSPPTVNINYSPSGQMWYVIICGYVAPIFGIIMFFVVCHYWTQQFPIDVTLDILESLKSSVKKAVLLKKVGEEYVETLEKLSRHLNESKFTDYKNIKDLNFWCKFSYPFKRPVHVILCYLYIALLVVFFVCCGSGKAWTPYYISVLVFGLIVNWYVILVTLFWPVIFAFLVVIILLILVFCKPIIMCLFCYYCFCRNDHITIYL